MQLFEEHLRKTKQNSESKNYSDSYRYTCQDSRMNKTVMKISKIEMKQII